MDTTTELSERQRAIVRTLLYFDVFGHPLRAEEVERYLPLPADEGAALSTDLARLEALGLITAADGYFALADAQQAVARRRAENARAEQRMPKARRMSRFIGRFPFVRGVMLSGSMSKGCLAEDGDIDYFVITEPGRLWIARTLLIAFKKLFLFNSRRDFCVNYFVDLDHLAIEDRNLFTATEVLTLLPTFGNGHCTDFFRANGWASDALPNAPVPVSAHTAAGAGPIKRLLERIFSSGLVDELDEWCMLRTMKHWRNKFAEFDRQQFDLALRTRKYVSKHHPRNFQQRVLNSMHERIRGFEERTGLSLDLSRGVQPGVRPSVALEQA